MSKFIWTELDDKAVTAARALAMDSVQKVGNGHPGTAMSLAPMAYLLFQKWMRHDPADPNGRAEIGLYFPMATAVSRFTLNFFSVVTVLS